MVGLYGTVIDMRGVKTSQNFYKIHNIRNSKSVVKNDKGKIYLGLKISTSYTSV